MGFFDWLSGSSSSGSSNSSGSNHSGDDVKAVPDTNRGGYNNYFGGKGSADGPGHGHIHVNDKGDADFIREPSKDK